MARWIGLDPGVQRTVRVVRINGRRDVSERVLRKGSTLTPGEVLTNADVDLSASQIANFSPISRVDVRTTEVPGSQVDVDFDVVEREGGGLRLAAVGAARGAWVQPSVGRRQSPREGLGLNLRGSWDSVEQKIFLVGSLPPLPGGRLRFLTTVVMRRAMRRTTPTIFSRSRSWPLSKPPTACSGGPTLLCTTGGPDTRTYEKDPRILSV